MEIKGVGLEGLLCRSRGHKRPSLAKHLTLLRNALLSGPPLERFVFGTRISFKVEVPDPAIHPDINAEGDYADLLKLC